MKTFWKILSRILIVIVALIALIIGSIPVDVLLGGGRVEAVANTRIPNGDGPEILAYVAYPTSAGPHPVVIMVHEFWGLNQEIVGRAEALAQEGYLVIAPSIFRGKASNWIPSAIYQTASTPQSQITHDLDAVFTWLSSQPEALSDRVAILGFCFGGRTSLLYSLSNDKLAAAVVFYGPPVVDVDQLRSLSGSVLGIYGGADISISEADVNAFEAALNEAGVSNQISIYKDQPHAFVTMEGIHQDGSAPQQAWEQAVTFLNQTLKTDDSASRQVTPTQVADATDWGYLLRLAYQHALGLITGHHQG